jgi:hypothetical protein
MNNRIKFIGTQETCQNYYKFATGSHDFSGKNGREEREKYSWKFVSIRGWKWKETEETTNEHEWARMGG